MEYLIRSFEEGDIAQLIELCKQHAAYERVDYDVKDKAFLLHSALLSPTPALYCWVVVSDQMIVGYVTYTFDFSTWDAKYYLHLDCIFIKENFRSLGIGEVLIKRLIIIAKERDCINIQWQTPVFNTRAIKFYERIGANALDKKRFFIRVSS